MSSLPKQQLELYTDVLQLAEFDATEQEIFDKQFDALVGTDDSIRRALLGDRRSSIIDGVRAIKYQLDQQKFGGINAKDSEVAFGPIRLGHLKRANALLASWTFIHNATPYTFTDFLTGATAAKGFSFGTKHGVVIVGLQVEPLKPTERPYLAEINIEVGRSILIPISVEPISEADNSHRVHIIPIPTIVGLPKGASNIMMQVSAREPSAVERIKPIGFTVGLGGFLKITAPVAGDWTT